MRLIALLLALAACARQQPRSATSTAVMTNPLAVPWQRDTVYSVLRGADGVHLVEGRVVTPWEEAGKVTVTTLATGQTQTIPAGTGRFGPVEDARWCDVDADGSADIMVASEDRKLYLVWGPAFTSWTVIGPSTNRWMKVACADLDGDGRTDVVAGGKVGTPAEISFFTSATPRTAASWVRNKISDAGWVMSLDVLDGNGDGKLDVFVADRVYVTRPDGTRDYSLQGTRWLRNEGAGSWTHMTIWRPTGNEGSVRMGHFEPARVIDTLAPANRVTVRTTTDAVSWQIAKAFTATENVGEIHDVVPCNVDGDGIEDLVLSFAAADGAKSGVIWIRGSDGARGEISGEVGTKYDNVECVPNALGLDDVLTSEQIEYLGVVLYRNPFGGPT